MKPYVYQVATALTKALRGKGTPEHLIRRLVVDVINAMKAGDESAFGIALKRVTDITLKSKRGRKS